VFDCLERDAGGQSIVITPAWLCSDTTYKQRLPKYFNEMGMTED
jgi:hypothetical protein